MTVVFTSVVADLIHVGHLNLLNLSKAMGDSLIVGVLSDKVVEGYKRKPVIPEKERLMLVSNIKCVDLAILQDELDPSTLLEEYNVDVIVHGDDWKEDFPGAEYMRSRNKLAVNVPYYKGRNTTGIINQIKGIE